MGDTFDFIPNYTGPNISDGKIQKSVEFGSAVPKNDLDVLSRLHDSAYAKWDDYAHRTAADAWYSREAQKLGTTQAAIAADAVLYGNAIMRSLSNYGIDITNFHDSLPILLSKAVVGGLPGLVSGIVSGAVKNMYNLHNYILDEFKLQKELQAYFATDPKPWLQYTSRVKKMTETLVPFRGEARSDLFSQRASVSVGRAIMAPPKVQQYEANSSVIHSQTNTYPAIQHYVFRNNSRRNKKKKNRRQ